MSSHQNYKHIAQKLFDIFYVDDRKYGYQLANGSYRLVRERITPVTIEDMLINNKSLLTYQEFHTLDKAYIKWICIDLDIDRKDILANQVNPENLELVKKSADDICSYLESVKIPFLLEFSGRRGFHIWIVFEELLTKEEGHCFISFILSKVKLRKNIKADKFPSTPDIHKNSKGIGKGVKLPLSKHKRSNKLSYFIDNNNTFDTDTENWLSIPNDDFIRRQLLLLRNFNRTPKESIQPFLDEYIRKNTNSNPRKISLYQRVSNSFLPNDTSLEDIISSLKQCYNLDNLLKDYQKGLSGKERSILVGLLGNLKTENDSSFGYNILLELFSRMVGFNKEITIKKLEAIKYYSPISCSYWNKCERCKKSNCGITSPIQLIKGVTLEDIPSFRIKNIDDKLFSKLQKALHKYSLINDEVPLFPQLKKIEHSDKTNIYNRIEDIYSGNISLEEESYRFLRNENQKIRILYNLNHKDNLISTYFLFILSSLYYSEISNFSLGYQISQSFYNGNIFANWFANWSLFSRKIEHVLDNEEYNNHFLVKIDVKDFYDSIEHQRLRIKLLEEAPKKIKQKLDKLAPKELNKYKNIIVYLISLTKKVTGNDKKGVPQGPAYARYLAELYLLGLDQTIEEYIGLNRGREFYNRFVDDIYIFLDSKERAFELNNKIKKWLTLNNLKVNVAKSEIANVKIYREAEKFKKYKNNIKYTINKVNKNKDILSNEDIQTALIELENLTHDTKFGLKDNLRFFFYQFQDDNRLTAIRKKLAVILPYSDDGRGTLYMIFYKDLLRTLPEYFIKVSENIDKVSGLSLTHYLNTILFEWDKIGNININQLIEKISVKRQLSDADKLLILTISMKQGIPINEDFLKRCSPNIKASVLETPDLQYSIENYALIEDKLSNINNNELFIKELFRMIRENIMTLDVAQKLASYSFTRFSIWSENKQELVLLNIEANLLMYYHCLCFFTLFYNSMNHRDLTQSWINLLEKSTEIKIKTPINFSWLKQLECFRVKDFSRNSYSLLLANLEGSKFSTFICLNDFVAKYRDIILILLFAQKQNNLNGFSPGIKGLPNNSLFLKWLTNPNASLYPNNHNVCIQNLALNGLIVLQDTTAQKIFIKSISKDIKPGKYEFIEYSEFNNNEFEYSTNEYSNIKSEMNTSNLIGFMTSLVREIEKHDKFKDTYKRYLLFYNPPLFKEGNPLVPFYSLFEKAVSSDGTNKHNDIKLYWNSLLSIVSPSEKENIKISTEDNPYNYSLKEFDEKFYLKTLVNDDAGKINFLKNFVNKVNNAIIKTVFDFQYYWTLTILDT